ncbi:iron uptake porin [Pleurocapsa sp. FMAR1]|uniref:iron uptake porin n=1 Tax=Pleurocapsa sp. FMAR1 TaxID=3040204 RepID=UPI0029C707B2|nr:iron uptake porin [Pleurocapsa sp. FMAR1]
MSRFWVKARLIVPICTTYLSLSPSIEAAELPKLLGVNLNQHQQFMPQVLHRQAEDISNFYSEKNNRTLLLTQINSVDQLRDLKSTDWAYAALKNLSDRYGCISGYSDRTFRGEQPISRFEFAAGLNNCLSKIESLISNSDSVPQTDVDLVSRLIQEFQSDLAILKGKTDGSQARLQDLEATQFSTTSKLQGEAIFGLGSLLAGDRDSTVLGSRLRLNIETSFGGDDLLLTRLSSLNFPGFSEETGTFQGELAFADPEQDDFQLEVLQYTFGVGDKVDFILGATGTEADDIADTINVLDGDGGSGAISRFGTRNPIYYQTGDAGLGIVGRPIEQIEISAGYLASTANDSNSGSGLFNGSYSALGQIAIAPIDSLKLAATYIHSYDQSDTETGTNRANLQSQTAKLLGEQAQTVSNSYGLELSWSISDRLIIGGWGGFSKVNSLSNLNQQIERGTQNIWNWAATLALPDLGKEGNLAGIVVGSEPTVTNSSINNDNFGEDSQRSLHLEAFYQYQVNDNIAITPGVVWITKPDTDIDSNDLVVGTIRTTFSF